MSCESYNLCNIVIVSFTGLKMLKKTTKRRMRLNEKSYMKVSVQKLYIVKVAVYGVRSKLCELHHRYPIFEIKTLTSTLSSLQKSHLLSLAVIVILSLQLRRQVTMGSETRDFRNESASTPWLIRSISVSNARLLQG